MPVDASGGRAGHQIVRRVEWSAATHAIPDGVSAGLRLRPRRTQDRDRPPEARPSHCPELTLGLATRVPLEQRGRRGGGRVRPARGAVSGVRAPADRARRRLRSLLSKQEEEEALRRTVDFWRRWLSKCTYTGRWREMVHRSALALKLLTFEPTGAIVAAPTCSLPEGVGGVRNWDYRYTWIRDAAFTLYGLLRIGFTEEADSFMDWLEARCQESGSRRLAADHVRHRRAHRPDRGDPGSPRRLPRLAAGADRQRRLRPAAARHLRRADGRGLPLQQVRQPRSPTTSGAICDA